MAYATEPEAADAPSHLTLRGEALSAGARWAEAAEAFEAAAAAQPTDAQHLINHAAALLHTGEAAAAARRFRRAVAMLGEGGRGSALAVGLLSPGARTAVDAAVWAAADASRRTSAGADDDDGDAGAEAARSAARSRRS